MSDCLSLRRQSHSAQLHATGLCLLCHSSMVGGKEACAHSPTCICLAASQKCVWMRTPTPTSTQTHRLILKTVTADALLILLGGVCKCILVHFYLMGGLWQRRAACQQCVTYSSAFLLGFGCSKTSVCFMILSVQSLVFSARTKRFSKWASNSVFSAWPNFSSVNWKTKQPPKMCAESTEVRNTTVNNDVTWLTANVGRLESKWNFA